MASEAPATVSVSAPEKMMAASQQLASREESQLFPLFDKTPELLQLTNAHRSSLPSDRQPNDTGRPFLPSKKNTNLSEPCQRTPVLRVRESTALSLLSRHRPSFFLSSCSSSITPQHHAATCSIRCESFSLRRSIACIQAYAQSLLPHITTLAVSRLTERERR